MKGVEQPPQFHPEGDVWIHTRLMIEGLAGSFAGYAGLGRPAARCGQAADVRSAESTGDRIRFSGHAEIGARMTEEICHRLRFSTDDTEQIESLVANHMRFKDVSEMRPATLKRFVRLPRFDEHLALHRLDCLSSHRMLGTYEFVRRFLARDSSGGGAAPATGHRRGPEGVGLPAGAAVQGDLSGSGRRPTRRAPAERDEALAFIQRYAPT